MSNLLATANENEEVLSLSAVDSYDESDFQIYQQLANNQGTTVKSEDELIQIVSYGKNVYCMLKRVKTGENECWNAWEKLKELDSLWDDPGNFELIEVLPLQTRMVAGQEHQKEKANKEYTILATY